jgi:3-phosphoshikimate 1-carboxyvinyltransferase|tara:strand:+ start:5922 stop:7232 length:1311 start_codon:yes stop_codon:yes gene_type:complete
LNLTSTNTNSLNGEIICPGDKSISQRILILGSLLNCDMEISGFLDAKDPNSTLNALNEIGASINKSGSKVILCKRELPFIKPSQNLDLGNSGTGMRLMIGLISGLGINATLVGDASLSKRPMSRVIKPLKEMGAKIQSNEGKSPIEIIESNISSEFEYKMPIASAQVKSSLILASLSSNNSITIIEPKITRDHTERMIEYFGGSVTHSNDESGRITVDNSKLTSKDSYEIVGDFSSAAFVIVATLISKESKVIIKNVGLNPSRCGLLEILVLMGANIEIRNQKITCNEESGDIFVKSSYLNGIDVPEDIIPNIIDEIPILSIAAAFAKGTTSIKNASELRVKESDRLEAISDGLKKLNIRHETFEDGISITGTSDLIAVDEEINSFDDHRIAMSFLVAGIRSVNNIKVRDCKNIETSFPGFKDIMNSIGMKIDEKN